MGGTWEAARRQTEHGGYVIRDWIHRQTAVRSYLTTELCSFHPRKLSHSLGRIVPEWWGLGQWCPTFLFFTHKYFQLWNKHRKPHNSPSQSHRCFPSVTPTSPSKIANQNIQSWSYPYNFFFFLIVELSHSLIAFDSLPNGKWWCWLPCYGKLGIHSLCLFSFGWSLLPGHLLPPLTCVLLPPTGHLVWTMGQKAAVARVADNQLSSPCSLHTHASIHCGFSCDWLEPLIYPD